MDYIILGSSSTNKIEESLNLLEKVREDFLVQLIIGGALCIIGWLCRKYIFSLLKKIATKAKNLQKASRANKVTVFEEWGEAEKDIEKQMADSRSLRVMASRGGFLCEYESGTCNPYLAFMNKSDKSVIVLLPNINSDGSNGWIEYRANEMAEIEGSAIRSAEQLRANIQSTIVTITPIIGEEKDSPERKLKFFDMLHLGKIIILDKVAYFQPYLEGKFGKDGRVYKYGKNADMYMWLDRVFNAHLQCASNDLTK